MFQKLTTLLTALLFFCLGSDAQTWQRYYPHYFNSTYGVLDADYQNWGIIMRSDDSASSSYFKKAVCINETGDSLWHKPYDDSLNYFSVASMTDGSAIVAAFTQTGIDYGVGTYLMQHLDASGNVMFEKTFYSPEYGTGPGVQDYDLPRVLATTNNEYYFIYARDSFANFGLTDTMFFRNYIEKYDANDNLLWTQVDEKHYNWWGVGFAGQRATGKSFQLGMNNTLIYKLYDVDYNAGLDFIMCRDANGSLLWQKAGSDLAVNEPIAQAYNFWPVPANGLSNLFYLELYTGSMSDTIHKQKIVRLDANGNLIDSVTMANQDESYFFVITKYLYKGVGTSDGGYLCAAYITDPNTQSTSIGFVKYDANLDFLSFMPHPFAQQSAIMKPNNAGGAFFALAPYNVLNQIFACNVDSLYNTFPAMVAGDVVRDNNIDCQNNTGDVARQYKAVLAQEQGGGYYYAMSDEDGHYELNLPEGDLNISHSGEQYYGFVCPPSGGYNYNVTNSTNITNAHFFDSVTQNVRDLAVTMAAGNFVPGFDQTLNVFVANNGTTTESGTLTLTLDNDVTCISSNPAPASVSGNVLTYNITNLADENTTSISVLLNTPIPTTLGDEFVFAASIPLVNDTTPNNNDDTLTKIVVGSYDPNQKTSNRPLMMHAEDEILYMVEFQNTGTLYATHVVVEDTLSDMLNLFTFKMLSATHNITNVQLLENRRLRVSFNNIYLPDSNTNEPGSHGHFIFSIKPNKYIQIGETITNTAHIFFDFNQAIVTNTTLNIIADNPALNVPFISTADNISLYPNPTEGNVSINVPGVKGNWDISVYDVTGKELSRNSYQGQTNKIDMSTNLPAGLYMVQIKNKTEHISVTKKLIIKK